MKRIVPAVLVMLVLLATGCACRKPPAYVLSVPLNPQQTSMWCWAAGGEMTMDFLGGNVQQCDEANKRFHRSDCCNTPTPTACVKGGWPEYAKYNFSAKTSGALSWNALREQFYCKKKPVAFSWGWSPTTGHLMVARGYANILGTKLVYMNDPWPPPGSDPANPFGGDEVWITYDHYVATPGHHVHWTDFYDITKQ